MPNQLVPNLFGNEISSDDVLDLFAQQSGWEARYRQIILLGKQLSELPQVFKNEEHQVDGCESAAWLVSREQGGVWQFYVASDTRIVNGLLAIVLAAYNGKTTEQIDDFDIESYFDQLGLSKQLSPSRANGLHAVVQAIKGVAV
ncbi:cysteine desulfurase sulfur acceptor subunit CsdE [Motilimonas sp. E26]|uniref:cysteine desulfurase sulfur acceptor subunit CsdE n=1 Tax=Motilimonas sp. E26 TaxID=2865674 RepID=UPI001E59DCD4|nr:cysteine desulfurase sulfur acceptor subunit CsdE [Motilimonas sp. E26]MCE0558895.1 cysteine desulfurase sulfur acceptor subunit CsdE [Motilimonas sp. E26]